MQSIAINADTRICQLALRHFKILSGLFLIFSGIGVAEARPDNWESSARSYVQNSGSFSCVGCHGATEVPTLNMSAPSSVPFNVSEVVIELNGFGTPDPTEHFAFWQYQTFGSNGELLADGNLLRDVGNATSHPIRFDTDDDQITVRYCLLDGVATNGSSNRFWNCGTETVTRDARPNVAPTITSSNPGNRSLQTGGAGFDFTVTTTDDSGTPTVSVSSSNPQNVSETRNSANSFTLNPVSSGQSTITVTARDSAGLTSTQSFNVDVQTSIVNQPPNIALNNGASGSLELIAGDVTTVGVSITDEQIGSLTYATSSSNSGVATGSFSAPGTLSVNAISVGTATITLLVTDAEQLTATLSVDVTVSTSNAAPVATADALVYSNQEASQVFDVLLNDSDSNGDALSVVLDAATSSQGNALQLSGNSVSYQSQGVLTSNDFFSYRAQDPSGALSGSVVVTLIPSDQDGDNIVDALDNCSVFPNPDQSDMDSDSIGDLCDPDGTPGAAFVSGRQLVEVECLTCHLNGVSGAPLFNDDADWDALIQAAGGQAEDLLGSVLNGRGSMPGFSNAYSTQDLLQAIRYLSGEEDTGDVPPGAIVDIDLDDVADDLDNCPTVPNRDQLNSDGNSLGDACEPTADRDGDGIPFSLDDDDSNAGRLLATYPNTTNSTVFTSANTLSLGRVASAVAEANRFQQIAVVLPENAFIQGVSDVFPGVTVMTDTQHSSLMGIISLRAQTTSGEAEIIIRLNSNLPLNPVIRLFDTSSGMWSDFSIAALGRIASAPVTASGCPVSTSANYQAGLTAGQRCVRLNVQDGSANDADGIINSQVELIFNIARKALDDSGPVTVVLNPTKSGGGSAGPWILVMLLMTRLLLCSGSLIRTRR
ncbi:MAG: cytochrome c5 [Granulosicoccus sp.]|jgi:cytochrome c5